MVRIDPKITDHLVMLDSSAKVMSYLGTLLLREKKISREEYDNYWTWWKEQRPKYKTIKTPIEQVNDPQLKETMELFGATEVEEKKQIDVEDIPF